MTDVLDRSFAADDDAQPRPQPKVARPPFDLAAPGRVLLGVLSATAGTIHLAMVPSHWGESVAEGIGFAITGWVQLAIAVAVLFRPTVALLRFAILANVAFLAAWGVSRTWGLPFGEHSWHPQDASFVDLVCVGLEVALIAGAVTLLRRPGFGRGWDRSRFAIAAVVPISVIALATAALGSPSARDHASASHGGHGAAADGHAHSRGDVLSGLAALENGHQHGSGVKKLSNETQAALAAQLAQTNRLVEKYPNIAAAEAAGYRRAGPFAPGLGTHYLGMGNRNMADDVLITESGETLTPLLIFDGIEPDAPIAGFMYYAGGEPEGFIGPNDHWHYHTNTCVVFKDGGVEAPLGADADNVTKEMCDKYGGQLITNTGYMVHVWTVPGYESERGVFSNINPAITCPDGSYHTIPLEKLGFRKNACKNA